MAGSLEEEILLIRGWLLKRPDCCHDKSTPLHSTPIQLLCYSLAAILPHSGSNCHSLRSTVPRYSPPARNSEQCR